MLTRHAYTGSLAPAYVRKNVAKGDANLTVDISFQFRRKKECYGLGGNLIDAIKFYLIPGSVLLINPCVCQSFYSISEFVAQCRMQKAKEEHLNYSAGKYRNNILLGVINE